MAGPISQARLSGEEMPTGLRLIMAANTLRRQRAQNRIIRNLSGNRSSEAVARKYSAIWRHAASDIKARTVIGAGLLPASKRLSLWPAGNLFPGRGT